MKRSIDKEATFREAFAEVSLVDVGSQLKSVLGSMGCMAVFLMLSTAGGAGISALGFGFHVPNIVWIALFVFIFVMAFTGEKSYHEWTLKLFFPKMRFVGWVITTAYLTSVIEAFRLVGRLPDEMTRMFVISAIYLVLLLPAVLFVGLLDLGHNRLMEKRNAMTEQWQKE